ncbi:hypothetical protein [Lentzea sp. NPDC059081]|uniref:hypothetical protein n=1 Tax=Lentzea sp. NPDC059081 TaxID=3346719 RepID=UPI0036D1867C
MSAFDVASFPDRPDVDMLRAAVGVATHVPDEALLVDMARDNVRFRITPDGRLLGDLAISGPVTDELTGEVMARWFGEANGPKLWGRWPMPVAFQQAAAELNRRGRAEHERRAVADEARADDDRRVRARDADLAQRRADLLRQLAALDGDEVPVVIERSVPAPPPRRWRRS